MLTHKSCSYAGTVLFGFLYLSGCTPDGGPLVKDSAVVQYQEIGVCNGFQPPSPPGPTTTISAGPSQAFVIFRIVGLDNSKSTKPFAFKASSLFLLGSSPKSFADSTRSHLLRDPFAMSDVTLSPGEKRGFTTGDLLFVGDSTSASGASGAANIAFILGYEPAAGDPGISLDNKKNGQTSFPSQGDCRDLPY